MAETWLRIVTYRVAGAGTDAEEYLEQNIQDTIRMLESKAGFRGGHWGHDPEAKVMAAVTNWESLAAIDAVAPELADLHKERAKHGLTDHTEVNLCLVTHPTSWAASDWQSITSRRSSNCMRVYFYEPEHTDPGTVEHLRSSTEDVIKVLKGQQGFRLGYWGHDPKAGTMAAITYWDGRESINLAGPELERLHELRKQAGIAGGTVINLELLHTRIPPGGAAQGWLG
jgi:hypothetical protein